MMKIDKINDMQVVCELTEDELSTMDLHINTLMDDAEKSTAFMNALIDVALEHTNMLNIKEQAYLDLSVDNDKKKIKVLINGMGANIFHEDFLGELAALLQGIGGIMEEITDEEDIDEEDSKEDESEADAMLEYMDEQYYTYKTNLKQMAAEIKYTGHVCIEFKTLDEITKTLKKYNKEFTGESELLKNDKHYILLLTFTDKQRSEYNNLIFSIADFVDMIDITHAKKAYMDEHYEVIIAKEAFNKMLHL
jgi:hypothetical protein